MRYSNTSEKNGRDPILEHIRIWQEINIDELDKHLLIIDDLNTYCNSCKKNGIKSDHEKKCPECGTEFKYIASRTDLSSTGGTRILGKIKKEYPELLIVDYNDYKHLSDKNKAKGLFK